MRNIALTSSCGQGAVSSVVLAVPLKGSPSIGFVFLGPRHRIAQPIQELIVSSHEAVSLTSMAGDLDLRDFDGPTVKWAIEHADFLAIWSTENISGEINTAAKAISDGAKFVTTIATTPSRASEWIALARRLKRPSAKLAVFNSESRGTAR